MSLIGSLAQKSVFLHGPALAVVGYSLLGLVLRLWGLTDKALWFDEAWVVHVATQPLMTLLNVIVEDALHPPLHWLVLHTWTLAFGTGEFAVRSLGIAAGTASIPLTFAVAAKLTDTRIAHLTTGLTAVSPALVSSDQEVRGYSLLMLLGLGATYAFLAVLDNPGRRMRLMYIVLSALVLYTHYLGAFLLLAHVTAWLVRTWPPRSPEVPLFLAIYPWVALLYLPWLVFGTTQGVSSLTTLGGFGTSVGSSLAARFATAAGSSVDTFVNLSWGPALGIATFGGPLAAGLAGLLFAGTAVIGAAVALKRRDPLPLAALSLAIIGAIGIQAIGVGHRPARYAAFVAPFYYLLLSWGTASIPRAAPRAAAFMLLLVISTAGLGAWYRVPSFEDWRTVAQHVDAGSRPGDALLFNYSLSQLPFDYYSRSMTPRYGFPQAPNAANPETLGVKTQRLIDEMGAREEISVWFDDANIVSQLHDRLWLIESHERLGPALRRAVQAKFLEVQVQYYRGITVRLYEPIVIK